jgi:flap endonuclease-1
MGIQYLNKYIKKMTTHDAICKVMLNDLSNKIIAIDTSIYLYKFISNNTLLESIYVMIILFKQHRITPIFVFDGIPPIEKQSIIIKRQKDKLDAQTKCEELEQKLNLSTTSAEQLELLDDISALKKKFIKLRKKDIERVRNLMDAFGVCNVEAQGEADELCAKLVITKKAYACLSEDMDLFLYGCPRVLRYLSLANSTCVIYYLDKIIDDLNISFKEFKEICVLSGSEYITNNTFNLYSILHYFKEFKEAKEAKKNNPLVSHNFYEWFYKNNNIKTTIPLTELYNAYSMYQISSTNLPIQVTHLKMEKPINYNKVKEIMQPEGFLFIE